MDLLSLLRYVLHGLFNTLYDLASSNIIKNIKVITEVEAGILDNILRELKLFKVNFIKMDIEGAEIETLIKGYGWGPKGKTEVSYSSVPH
jgi:FkbM family methyltransferase